MRPPGGAAARQGRTNGREGQARALTPTGNHPHKEPT